MRNSPPAPPGGGALGCLIVLLGLAFWGGVIYVAVHFIGKFW